MRLGGLQRRDVGVVLTQQCTLLFQLQQARRAHRVITGGFELDATAGLLGRLEQVVQVALIAGRRVLVKLCSRNTHGLRLLIDC
ncbi:hypothetical protein D3C71_1982540 [compost metagenome]